MQRLLKDTSCTQIPHRFSIKKGVPFAEPVKKAKEKNEDMVVMGTKGRSNIAGILFGSQAEKMFRHCPSPLRNLESKAFVSVAMSIFLIFAKIEKLNLKTREESVKTDFLSDHVHLLIKFGFSEA